MGKPLAQISPNTEAPKRKCTKTDLPRNGQESHDGPGKGRGLHHSTSAEVFRLSHPCVAPQIKRSNALSTYHYGLDV